LGKGVWRSLGMLDCRIPGEEIHNEEVCSGVRFFQKNPGKNSTPIGFKSQEEERGGPHGEKTIAGIRTKKASI